MLSNIIQVRVGRLRTDVFQMWFFKVPTWCSFDSLIWNKVWYETSSKGAFKFSRIFCADDLYEDYCNPLISPLYTRIEFEQV